MSGSGCKNGISGDADEGFSEGDTGKQLDDADISIEGGLSVGELLFWGVRDQSYSQRGHVTGPSVGVFDEASVSKLVSKKLTTIASSLPCQLRILSVFAGHQPITALRTMQS